MLYFGSAKRACCVRSTACRTSLRKNHLPHVPCSKCFSSSWKYCGSSTYYYLLLVISPLNTPHWCSAQLRRGGTLCVAPTHGGDLVSDSNCEVGRLEMRIPTIRMVFCRIIMEHWVLRIMSVNIHPYPFSQLFAFGKEISVLRFLPSSFWRSSW